jgi:NUMOD3 motif
MFYTIYKIINKINGKTYIGCHKTINLEDGYMGSGKYLNRAIEKNGIENFEKQILFVYNNREEMLSKEKELVNEDYLTNENTYNLKLGGEGGWDHQNLNSEIQKKKAIKSNEKQKLLAEQDPHFHDNRKKVGAENLRKAMREGKIKRYDATGKKHSEETKRKMSIAKKGIIPWNKGLKMNSSI